MHNSIKEIRQKIKLFIRFIEQKDIFISLAIILIAFGSFGLGRLSKVTESTVPVRVENFAQMTQQQAQVSSAVVESDSTKNTFAQGDNMYVASKNGSKYHFPWCSGAQRMKEENKIWFSTTEEARSAGYTPAGNCKGLE